jgi:hypothetical protein
MSPLRRLIRWHVPKRETVLWIVLALVAWLYALSGCATTPSPACQPMLQRLMRHRDFTICLTGPWPSEWRWLSAARWVSEREALDSLNVLVLPSACHVFDVDSDGDVDLRDFHEGQNRDD